MVNKEDDNEIFSILDNLKEDVKVQCSSELKKFLNLNNCIDKVQCFLAIRNNYFLSENSDKLQLKINSKSISFIFNCKNTIITSLEYREEEVDSIADLICNGTNSGKLHQLVIFSETSFLFNKIRTQYLIHLCTNAVDIYRFIKKMGYPINDMGVCYGIAMMAIQAFCRDDFETFLARRENIKVLLENKLGNLINEVENFNMQTASLYSLHKYYTFLDLKAFCDGVVFYQGLKCFENTDQEMCTNLQPFFEQNYRNSTLVFSEKYQKITDNHKYDETAYKNDFFYEENTQKMNDNFKCGDFLCSKKRQLRIWTDESLKHLIENILNSKYSICYAINSIDHRIALGGNMTLGCYLINHNVCIPMFSPLQFDEILKAFELNNILVVETFYSQTSLNEDINIVADNNTESDLIDLNICDNKGNTIFQYSSVYDFPILFFNCISQTLALEEPCENKKRSLTSSFTYFSPLYLVARYKYLWLVKKYVNAVCEYQGFTAKDKLEVIFNGKYDSITSPLNIAAELGFYDIVVFLLDEIIKFIEFEKEMIVSFLSINMLDESVIFLSSQKGYIDIVKYVYEKIMNLDEIDFKDKTQLLFSKNSKDESVLFLAVKNKHMDIACYFIEMISHIKQLTFKEKLKFLVSENKEYITLFQYMVNQKYHKMAAQFLQTILNLACFCDVQKKQIFFESELTLDNFLQLELSDSLKQSIINLMHWENIPTP